MDDWWNKNRRFFSFSTDLLFENKVTSVGNLPWLDHKSTLLWCNPTFSGSLLPSISLSLWAERLRSFCVMFQVPGLSLSAAPQVISASGMVGLRFPNASPLLTQGTRAPGCPRPRARPLSSGHCSQGQRATDAWPPLCIPAASTPWPGTVRLEAGPPLERLG